MFYIIYKTTNKLNNHFYIGKHQCETLEDGYLGFGVRLKQAIKKYGKENFTREILFIFDNELDMNNKEKELVTESLIADKTCYNMTLGGEGGPIFLGQHHSEETKQLLRDKRKLQPIYHKTPEQIERERQTRLAKNNGKYFSDETIQKIREAKNKYYLNQPKKIDCQESSDNENKVKRSKEELNKSRSEKMMGHEVSEETRKKLSDINKGKCPSNAGKVQVNNGIKNIYIFKEELELYLSQGWVRGKFQTKNK